MNPDEPKGHRPYAGDWHVQRRIHLAAAPTAAVADRLIAALDAIEGTREIRIHGRKVAICYDLTDTDYLSLCNIAEQAGAPVAHGLLRDWIAQWHQYADTNGRHNAARPAAACCNKPPVAANKNRRL